MAMTDGVGIRESQQAPAPPVRRPLTRLSILEAGLRLIDQQGLEAFTMRKLAQELGVDPMSMYRHFENKDALLDGVADLLWGEVALPGGDAGWEAILRSMAISLRALARAHPHAYALLCNRQTLPLAMLRLCDVILEQLQRAGFARKRAMEILCTVCSYAIGFAMVELTALPPEPSDRAAEEGGTADIRRFTQIMRRLPRETPDRLVEVACVLTVCDTEAPFTVGLDLMLTGLASGQGK